MSELLLGAHVSTQGGVAEAPARGRAIGASAIQIFTKTPNQWREPVLGDGVAGAARVRGALAAADGFVDRRKRVTSLLLAGWLEASAGDVEQADV